MALRAPVTWQSVPEHLRKLSEILNGVLDGRTNAVGSVTLTNTPTTTTLTDPRIGTNTVITFMPQTSGAALEMLGLHVTARGKGTATLTHSNAETTRTYAYMLAG